MRWTRWPNSVCTTKWKPPPSATNKLFPKSTAPEFSGLVVYYCIAKGEHLPEEVHTEHFISQGGLGFRQVTVAGGGSDGRWDSLQATLQVGARMTEKIDGLLDRARPVKAT